jgi:hypothetical protein
MTIIDSQVHAYEANTPQRPWHSVPNWPDHVTGDETVAAMDKASTARSSSLDPAAVRSFVLEALQRLNLPIAREKREDVYRLQVSREATVGLPDAIRFSLPTAKSGQWLVSFTSPTPEGAEYLGRNHPFIATLAHFLMEEALTKSGAARATRCGVIRTRAVARLTAILLLRVRYLLQQPDRPPLLSEEVVVRAFTPAKGDGRSWLADDEAQAA